MILCQAVPVIDFSTVGFLQILSVGKKPQR